MEDKVNTLKDSADSAKNADSEANADNEKKDSLFNKEIKRYILQVRSLGVAFPLISEALYENAKEKRAEVRDFLAANALAQRTDDKSISYDMPSNVIPRFLRLNKDFKTFHTSRAVISKSLIVSLVTEYDSFIGKLLRAIFVLQPNMLNSSDKSMSFSQLLAFDSLDEARNSILDREVSGILYRSREEQLEYLTKKTNINLLDSVTRWKEFVELTERRNLFVHGDGQVSSQYIEKCSRAGVKFDLEQGHVLEVDNDYFASSYHTILHVGLTIGALVWKKFDASDDIIAKLNNVVFDLIVDGEYIAAQEFAEFLLKPPMNKNVKAQDELLLILNLAQAYKWQGKEDVARSILKRKDWSVLGELYRLAERTLCDDFDSAAEVMRVVVTSKLLERTSLQEWPIFRQFRQSEQYTAVFNELFPNTKQSVETAKSMDEEEIEPSAEAEISEFVET